MDEEPEFGQRREGGVIGRTHRGRLQVVLTNTLNARGSKAAGSHEALTAVDGTDYGVHSPTWISRFTE